MTTKRNDAIEKSLEVDVNDASIEELEAAEEVLDRAKQCGVLSDSGGETLTSRGLAKRTADSKAVFRTTRDPRAAIREYCRGNRWLEENAKAVGNWALMIFATFAIGCGGGTPGSPSAPIEPTPPTLTASVVTILNIEIIEQNNTFWRFSWRVRVNASGAGQCFLRTKYLDPAGVELHEGIETIQVTPGDSTQTGQDLVDSALGPRVATLEARISSCLQ